VIHNVGSISLDSARIESAVANALLWRHNQRMDSHGPIRHEDAIDAYARSVDADALQALGSRGWSPPPEMLDDARRADALPSGSGIVIRDLEYVRSEVLDEALPALNAERLFRADASVPLGATSHVMQRWVTSGEAQIHRGGSSVPLAGAGKVEERFPVVYVVCAVSTNFFQALSVNYAGLRTFQAESMAARRLVQERLNRLYWGGDVGTGLKGVLNYPHMSKMVIPTLFDGTATGAAVVASLSDMVGTPRILSKQVFYPNRIAVSETIHQYLYQTQFASGTDTSIAEYFIRGQVGKPNGIKVIEAVHELEADSDEMTRSGAPAGYHGILSYRDDLSATRRVVVQEPTWLPLVQNGPFDTLHVMFAATGGMVMPDVGANVLAFVSV